MEDRADPSRSGRNLGVRVPAVLGLLLFAFFFSLIGAEAVGLVRAGSEGSQQDPPPSASARLGASRPGEAVHVIGTLAVLTVGGSGLVALIGRPRRSGSAYQVLGTMIGLSLTAPLVGDPDNFGGQAGPIDPLFVILVVPSILAAGAARPWRDWRSHGGARLRFLVLAALAALPAGWYGVGQALMQRNTFPPTADPHHNAHWWAMAVLAFAVILVVASAALPSTGWRLGPRVAGLAAVTVGSASLVATSSASAVGAGWGVAAIVWGLAAVWLTSSRAAQLGAATDHQPP